MKWKRGKYNFEYLDLGLFVVSVGWEKGGHCYSYLNIKSKPVFEDVETCKIAAEASVVRQLRAVLDLFG